jgi:hypothetical protein
MTCSYSQGRLRSPILIEVLGITRKDARRDPVEPLSGASRGWVTN